MYPKECHQSFFRNEVTMTATNECWIREMRGKLVVFTKEGIRLTTPLEDTFSEVEEGTKKKLR